MARGPGREGLVASVLKQLGGGGGEGRGMTAGEENSALGARDPEFQWLPATRPLCDLTKYAPLAFGPQFCHMVTVKGTAAEKGLCRP